MSLQYFQNYFGYFGCGEQWKVLFEEIIVDGVQKHYSFDFLKLDDRAPYHKVVVVVFCGVCECRVYHREKDSLNGVVFSQKIFPKPSSDFKSVSSRERFFQSMLGPMLHQRFVERFVDPLNTSQVSVLKKETFNTLFDTFLAMYSLQLPIYILVWITDWLYGKVISLHKKVALFERISKSVVKAKQKK